jgi:hypothetical protein
MRAGTGTRVRSTKGGDALPNCAMEPQGHIPVKGHFSFLPLEELQNQGRDVLITPCIFYSSIYGLGPQP